MNHKIKDYHNIKVASLPTNTVNYRVATLPIIKIWAQTKDVYWFLPMPPIISKHLILFYHRVAVIIVCAKLEYSAYIKQSMLHI